MVTGGLAPSEETKSDREIGGGFHVELTPFSPPLGIVVIGEEVWYCLVVTGGRIGFSLPEGGPDGNSKTIFVRSTGGEWYQMDASSRL